MDDREVRIGIAGLGNIAATHARAINTLDSARIVAACSRSENNRIPFGQQFQIPVYADYDELLAHPGLHAVSICTPSGTHLDYGIKAAEAGKHVIVEKPIEVTVQRGKKLVECCRQNGVKLAVIYQNRFVEGAMQMKQAIDSGAIGKPVLVRASVKWFRDQDYYKKSNWRGTLALDGGGAVINQAVHTVDLLVWLLGDVASLAAFKDTITHSGIEAEDNAIAVMKLENGALAVFEASTSVVPAQPRYIEINGTKGTARLEGDRFSIENGASGELQKENPGQASGADSPLAGLKDQPHEDQFREIISAIIEGREPVVSGEESLTSLAIVESIYRSADQKIFFRPSDLK